jgi:hypothetical protein
MVGNPAMLTGLKRSPRCGEQTKSRTASLGVVFLLGGAALKVAGRTYIAVPNR